MASLAMLILCAAVISIGVYWYLLPKPIPGDIPYNKVSRNRLLGDLPELLKNIAVTRNPFDFLCDQIQQLQSPIIQVWLKPFNRPIVVLADPRETEDILLRRTNEFDRGQFFKDIFTPQVPYHHIVLPTNEQFKAQRRFISDAMSPAFLRDVGARRVYEAAQELLKLWRLKARLSDGRPFTTQPDIKNAVFDAIWAIAIGENPGGTTTQSTYLSEHQSSIDLNLKESYVKFPEAQLPGIFSAINLMIQAIESIVSSPIPQLHHRILKCFPLLRGAYATKDKAIDDMLQLSRQRFQKSEKQIRLSALDYFLHRDDQRAEKIGDHLSEAVIRDELFGFLQAGHEASSATLAWIVKYLTKYPACQHKLRVALLAAFPSSQGPSCDEITQARIPYLDAFIEECVRVSLIAVGATRTAVVDTQILSHFIPRGTEVYFTFGGAGYLKPPLPVSEEKRSSSSQKNNGRTGSWPPNTLGVFDPERWISEDTGDFNPQAGPLHIFGLGIRGCWGKKLAYLEMRIMVALLVLAFSFEGIPEELAGFEGQVKLTHEPRSCYVRLREL